MEEKNKEFSSTLTFILNGTLTSIESADPNITVLDYLRTQPNLTGTKRSCSEGGCGACTITVTRKTGSGSSETVAANSCLLPLPSVHGHVVTTIEGLGDKTKGYHPIQVALANHNGSQCGYCSPGMVMNIYGLLEKNPSPTAEQIEKHHDGNICRCTGYRPILDAMKTFAKKSENEEAQPLDKLYTVEDLETTAKPKDSNGAGTCCFEIEDVPRCQQRSLFSHLHHHHNHHNQNNHQSPLQKPLQLKRTKDNLVAGWETAHNLKKAFSLRSQYPSYPFLGGGTSRGVFKNYGRHDWNLSSGPTAEGFIDIRHLPELLVWQTDGSGLTIGAGLSLSETSTRLRQTAGQVPNGAGRLLNVLADAIDLIASIHIRSIGSVGGNLMIAHGANPFASDLHTALTGLNATYIVYKNASSSERVSAANWLNFNMGTGASAKILSQIFVPHATSQHEYAAFYRAALRHNNSHPMGNAGQRMLLSPTSVVISKPHLAYGGVSSKGAIVADMTASFLNGKNISDVKVVRAALQQLSSELTQKATDLATYGLKFALASFYRFVLGMQPSLEERLKSALQYPYSRPVSSGMQTYSTDPTMYPVSQPIIKLSALEQTSGEAKYTQDEAEAYTGTLVGAFVQSSEASATISKVDVSRALQVPGVVGFVSAVDVPGTNTTSSDATVDPSLREELFASSKVLYYGQAIGFIVADTEVHARQAASLVNVTYSDPQKPILTIESAIAANSFFPFQVPSVESGDVKKGFEEATTVVSGTIDIAGQYHFHMETQNAFVRPRLGEGGGWDVHSSTQWPAQVQSLVSRVLNVQQSLVDVTVVKLGGAFGAKVTRANHVAAACAVASKKYKAPVRTSLTVEENMKMIGKRHPLRCVYKVGADAKGMITALTFDFYDDAGYALDHNGADDCMGALSVAWDNVYYLPNVKVTFRTCKTNTPTNTAFRGPGFIPGLFCMEQAMEHLSSALGMPAVIVKEQNFYKQGQVTPYNQPLNYWSLPTIWEQLMKNANFSARQQAVDKYNATNLWTKQGLAIVPCKYGIGWHGVNYSAMVSIFLDGTVQVAHSGTEIGQGINTKVAQTVAYKLNVPLSTVIVGSCVSYICANGFATGGSITSELNALLVAKCCETLFARLEPYRKKTPDFATAVKLAFVDGVDLQERAQSNPPKEPNHARFHYNSLGAAISQIQLDVLTGRVDILQSDLLFDCGVSMNPAIDIGQVEGAFVMGIGYWMTEYIEYSGDGSLFTQNTWEYKPPEFSDIPLKLNVTLLKDAPNPAGVLSSKASGEPPLGLSSSVYFAILQAINASRKERGLSSVNIFNMPATIDRIQAALDIDPSTFPLS